MGERTKSRAKLVKDIWLASSLLSTSPDSNIFLMECQAGQTLGWECPTPLRADCGGGSVERDCQLGKREYIGQHQSDPD